MFEETATKRWKKFRRCTCAALPPQLLRRYYNGHQASLQRTQSVTRWHLLWKDKRLRLHSPRFKKQKQHQKVLQK